jgi:hypothetical protein
MEPHPPSSTEPLPDPYEICMEAAGPTSWPAERPGLSLLAAADVRGRVSLWLQGQVQVAELTAAVLASRGGENDGEFAGTLQEKEEQQEEEKYRLLHVSGMYKHLLKMQCAAGKVSKAMQRCVTMHVTFMFCGCLLRFWQCCTHISTKPGGLYSVACAGFANQPGVAACAVHVHHMLCNTSA